MLARRSGSFSFDVPDSPGQTKRKLLMMAHHHSEMIKAVREGNLNKVMNINAESPKAYLIEDTLGCTAVFVACSAGHHEIVEYLLSLGGNDILASDINGYNPLHAASSHRHMKVVEILLREGFSSPDQIDRVGSQGLTAFFVASIFGNLEIARVLLRAGANINVSNKDGNTALMVACKVGKADTVKFLLEEGADPNLENNEGIRALEHAKSSEGRSKNISKYLIESGLLRNHSSYHDSDFGIEGPMEDCLSLRT